MFNLKLNSKGKLSIRWPKKPAQVILLAERYIAYESSLSTSQHLQNITLDVLQLRLTAARAAINAAKSGEANRGSSAEVLRQALNQVDLLMDKIHILLRARNVDNLANMEYWGFPATQGVRGIIARKPYGQTAVINWLKAYVAKEASLPEAERIANPPLSRMQDLLTTIQAALLARNAGRNQREIQLAARNQEVGMLLNLLQLAAASRILLFYNGVVTNDLQLWGYIVES